MGENKFKGYVMKPITKKINDMIATFPFDQYMVDPDAMKTLGTKPQKPIEPEIGFSENIQLPATPANMQYAVNIIGKATNTTGVIEPTITNGNVHIPVAYMVKALQVRLCN